MELYRWQKDCLLAWEENGFRGAVHAVTGSGKTVLALAAIDRLRRRFPELRVKLVVPTIPLAQQWKTALLHHAAEEAFRPGFFGGGTRDDPDKPVMLYIVNSARAALSAHINRDLALRRHVLLICDEYHHDLSEQNRRIFGFLTQEAEAGGLYCSLGLSATPSAGTGDGLPERALGKEIFRYGFDDAGKAGILSPFTVCEVSAPFLPDELAEYSALSDTISRLTARLLRAYPQLRKLEKERFFREAAVLARQADLDAEDPAAAFLLAVYRRREVSCLARARTRCGLALLERLSPSDRVLIFCERIEQAASMHEAIRRRLGNISALYHSRLDREARARSLQEFRDNRARVLVSCRCLDEGVDVPEANIGIVLSSTAAERQRVQRLGRILRSAPGKEAACLYYIYIRESSDDAAYLPGLAAYRSFSLRYFPAEEAFSNDLYEYAAGELLRRAEQSGLTPEQLRELRSCLLKGLTRADYLLEDMALARRAAQSGSVAERNYWIAAKAVGRAFRE